MEVVELALHIVKAADLLGKCSLEGSRFAVELLTDAALVMSLIARGRWLTHISEAHYTQLAQCTDNLTAYLVGDVQLRQGHVR